MNPAVHSVNDSVHIGNSTQVQAVFMKIRLSHEAADKIHNKLEDLAEDDIIELDGNQYKVMRVDEDEVDVPGDNAFLNTIAYWQTIILRSEDRIFTRFFKYKRQTDCWRGCFDEGDEESYLVEVRPKEVVIIEYEEV